MQVAEIEDSGQALTKEEDSVRLLLPVLRAQSTGERQWWGWYLGTEDVLEVPGVRVLL